MQRCVKFKGADTVILKTIMEKTFECQIFCFLGKEIWMTEEEILRLTTVCWQDVWGRILATLEFFNIILATQDLWNIILATLESWNIILLSWKYQGTGKYIRVRRKEALAKDWLSNSNPFAFSLTLTQLLKKMLLVILLLHFLANIKVRANISEQGERKH